MTHERPPAGRHSSSRIHQSLGIQDPATKCPLRLRSKPVRSRTRVGRENPDTQGPRHKAPLPEVGPTCTTRTPVDSPALGPRTHLCSPASRIVVRVRFGACRFLSCGGSSASSQFSCPAQVKPAVDPRAKMRYAVIVRQRHALMLLLAACQPSPATHTGFGGGGTSRPLRPHPVRSQRVEAVRGRQPVRRAAPMVARSRWPRPSATLGACRTSAMARRSDAGER
jgi:hypothetical protein